MDSTPTVRHLEEILLAPGDLVFHAQHGLLRIVRRDEPDHAVARRVHPNPQPFGTVLLPVDEVHVLDREDATALVEILLTDRGGWAARWSA